MKRWTCRVAWCVMVVSICVFGMASYTMSASNATGQITINTEAMAQFAYAYAIVEPNPYDDTQDNVVVILTDQPFSDEAVKEKGTRKALVQENGMKYVEIVIASNEAKHWVQFFKMRLDPSGSSYREINGVGALELTVFDGKHVEGRFYADGEKDSSGNLYHFDFSFQTAILGGEDAPQTADAANADTTTDSSDIDEELAALSPKEKFERTVDDMRSLGQQVFSSHLIDLNHFPICPSEKDLPDIEFGKSEWGSASWEDYTDFYDGNFKDAWGTPFKYVSTDDGGEFTLTSYGADKAEGDGGGEFDADIVFSGYQFLAPPSLAEE